jgi:hypothetical protein
MVTQVGLESCIPPVLLKELKPITVLQMTGQAFALQ